MRPHSRPWREWTLRARMVVAIAVLAGVGLVVTDAFGIALLRSKLIGQVDGQLRRTPANRPDLRRFPPDGSTPLPHAGATSLLLVYDLSGQRVYISDETATDTPRLGGLGQLVRHAADRRPYTVDGTGSAWRVVVGTLPDGSGYAVAAVSLEYIQGIENQLIGIDLAVSALVLVLIAVAAATVVRIGLRPLYRMERAATEIAGGELSRRVEDADPHTESGRLGTALNAMLGRIESALADRTASERRLRQFLADASHELRTPLTSIQGFAELYRRGGAPPGPQLDEAMGRIEAEVGRMGLLVNDLLMLARMDEERPLQLSTVDLLEVAADAVRDAHVRVPTRFVLLDGFGSLTPVAVRGDEARLRQVVTNLVANALQHTPDEAQVKVRVGRLPGGATDDPADAWIGGTLPDGVPVAALEVGDTGPGLSGPDADRVFERLYRADPSRSRSHGGAGLGLSIVAAIVTAHGGRVELRTAPGRGARFRVLLPAEPDEVIDEDDPLRALDGPPGRNVAMR